MRRLRDSIDDGDDGPKGSSARNRDGQTDADGQRPLGPHSVVPKPIGGSRADRSFRQLSDIAGIPTLEVASLIAINSG